jgi:hypothetical protein
MKILAGGISRVAGAWYLPFKSIPAWAGFQIIALICACSYPQGNLVAHGVELFSGRA